MEGKHDVLYLVGMNPRHAAFTRTMLPLLRTQLSAGGLRACVVLMHDGVIGLGKRGRLPPGMQELLALDVKVMALGPDMAARGIPPADANDTVEVIDHDGLVDVMVASDRIVSML